MNERNNINRRNFLKTVGATVAAFTIVPRHVLGGTGYKAPSEKLNIAGIGIGGMGKVNLKNLETENIVALCDVDSGYSAKVFEQYPNAKKYEDYREMLEKQKDIDAVLVATPDHTHAIISMAAIRMGKHVYCQKPLTHTVYEARELAKAAREAKVATQMGNQGHSSEEIRAVKEWIADGAIGTVTEVHAWTPLPADYWPQGADRPTDTPPVPATLDWDLWLGPAPYRPYNPMYTPFKWRAWWDFGTGSLGDQACHTMDVPYYALDLDAPEWVEASFVKKGFPEPVFNTETYPVASIVRYKFPARGKRGAIKLTWYDGGLMPERPEELEPGRRMGNEFGGVIIVGDKGKIMTGCYGKGATLIPEAKRKAYKLPEKTIPRVNGSHESDWVQACKGSTPACSNFDYAGLLTETAMLGNIAIRTGKRLCWDSANMKITNEPDANQYLQCEYRKGWTL